MNKFLAAGFAFLFSLVLSGQGFIDDQLVPGIKAAEYVYDFYIPQNAYSDFNCPPKISKPHADTLFGFLDRLVGDNSEMEDKILQTMMDNNCRPYYTCRALNDLYLPNYLDALEKGGLSEIYGILPVALSGSNPGYHNNNGKAGAWQLSYIVGRKFGLTIDNYIDERFDIKQSTLTAVDYLKWPEQKGKRFEIVYHFFSLEYNLRIRVKFSIDDKEKSPSLTEFYKNANWLEREVYDMYGIKFEGHPDLRRILMYDEFKGYPLRKDYPLKKRQPRLEDLKDD